MTLRTRWQRFWFDPVPTSTIAVFRIAFGFVLVLWTISLLPDAVAFYSSEGVRQAPQLDTFELSLFEVSDAPAFAVAVVVVLLLAALCTMLGLGTQLATVVVFVVLVSLRRRDPYINNGGDSLVRYLAFFLMLSPAGAALSVDRWRKRRDDFWEAPRRAPWPLRLMQIQVAFVYLFTLFLKVQGERWVDGTAVVDSLRVGDLARFRPPAALLDSLLLANVLTYVTLALELALAVLVWHRAFRPYVLAAGVALHVFIEVTMSLGFFSVVMIIAYITFVPEDSMARAIDRARTRLQRARAPAPAT